LTLTVTLPRNAVTALAARAHEAVKVTLTAKTVNGTRMITATIRSLRAVATH
jgi:hypothetical protein